MIRRRGRRHLWPKAAAATLWPRRSTWTCTPGLIAGTTLTRLIEEHATGRFDRAHALWQLLILEGFLRSEMGAAAGPLVAEAA